MSNILALEYSQSVSVQLPWQLKILICWKLQPYFASSQEKLIWLYWMSIKKENIYFILWLLLTFKKFFSLFFTQLGQFNFLFGIENGCDAFQNVIWQSITSEWTLNYMSLVSHCINIFLMLFLHQEIFPPNKSVSL